MPRERTHSDYWKGETGGYVENHRGRCRFRYGRSEHSPGYAFEDANRRRALRELKTWVQRWKEERLAMRLARHHRLLPLVETPGASDQTARTWLRAALAQYGRDVMAAKGSSSNANFDAAVRWVGVEVDQPLTRDRLYREILKRYGPATPLAPRTAALYRSIWSQFCDYCVDREWIVSNPVKRINRELGRTTSDAKRRTREKRRHFTRAELEAIYAHAHPCAAAIFRVLALTGLRADELVNVRIDDLDDGVLDIVGKGALSRSLPIAAMPGLRAALTEVVRQRQMGRLARRRAGYLVPWVYVSLNNYLREALAAAKIAWPKGQALHAFRHTWSWVAEHELNWSAENRKDWLGHHLSETLTTYRRQPTASELKERIERERRAG